MDADELLLEWARTKFPEYARDKVLQHNHDVERTKAHNERNPDYVVKVDLVEIIKAHTLAHIRNCQPQIYAVDHAWECNCYSEYTRDDSWMIHFRVSCCHQLFTEVRIEVDSYDMPEVLRELADMDGVCMYDDPAYDIDW